MAKTEAAERSWTTVDKAGWGDGPWQDEPDKIQWIDEETNLDCLIHRGPMGNLCGYVGVPPGHPAHGKSYDGIDVDVHGGLTYSEFCQEGDDEAAGVCHIPLPGRPVKVWWLGFDCGHAFDVMPAMDARQRVAGLPPLRFGNETYKSVAFVRAEIRRLARQLAEI